MTHPAEYNPVDFGAELPVQADKNKKKNLIVTILAIVVVLGVAIGAALLLTSSGTKSAADIAAEFNTGLTQATAGQNDAAIATFQQVIKDNPKNIGGYAAVSYFNIGSIHQQQGDIAGAISNYQEALKIAPDYLSAKFNLAVAVTPTNPTYASTLYKEIIAIKPSDANSLFNLGLLTYEAGNQAQGRIYIIKAIALQPSLASRVPTTVILHPKR